MVGSVVEHNALNLLGGCNGRLGGDRGGSGGFGGRRGCSSREVATKDGRRREPGKAEIAQAGARGGHHQGHPGGEAGVGGGHRGADRARVV